MGIVCEINLFKTPPTFIPGTIVSGTIKYDIKENTVFKKITVSLKGKGYLLARYKQRETNLRTVRTSEEYVKINYIIYKNEGNDKVKAGSYEAQFNFELPSRLPTSFAYSTKTFNYFIHCFIAYYVRIKFERSGFTESVKKFTKTVDVKSAVTAKLMREPTAYGEEKTLKQKYSRRTQVVKLIAVIKNSIVTPGGKVNIDCEVRNETSFNIRGVSATLIESNTFRPKGLKEVTFSETVNDTKVRSGIVSVGETKNLVFEVSIPDNVKTIENSNLVSREYLVLVAAELSIDHEDVVIKIPVQICDHCIGDPPTYLQAMLEMD